MEFYSWLEYSEQKVLSRSSINRHKHQFQNKNITRVPPISTIQHHKMIQQVVNMTSSSYLSACASFPSYNFQFKVQRSSVKGHMIHTSCLQNANFVVVFLTGISRIFVIFPDVCLGLALAPWLGFNVHVLAEKRRVQ